ncbi:MAG: 4Fe-4S dicluster domain-containing protein [Armatimonadetes bacterium]|nr:4Fe-4S dicluster domain-containing protein [Armatimonadota bacterium]
MKEKNPVYVKSFEQFEDPSSFESVKADEFPHRSSLLDINRRDLLKFVGGTVALAGLASGCRYLPQQKIVPFVQAPEDRLPGQEATFASATTLGGYSTGVLVRSYEGRPVKIEGNPLHPSCLGSSDARMQAELAVMYDPDRLQQAMVVGEPASWEEFYKEAKAALSKAHDGAGAALLTPNVGSPALAAQISAFLAAYPGAKWYQYEPVNRDNVYEGAVMAFGQPVETVYDFSKADVVLTVDCELFLHNPGNVRYQRDIMARRFVDEHSTTMSRIYAVEGTPTTIGAVADHRWRLRPTMTLDFVRALASRLGVAGAADTMPKGLDAKAVDALAADLRANRERSVVVAGDHLPADVHALVHAINHSLGNLGSTVHLGRAVHLKPGGNLADIKELATAMAGGQVSFLMVCGGNPVYDAPSDLKFAEALGKVQTSVHLSLYDNETSELCRWRLPESHFLESWGDGRGHDGTASIVQPLINPIYDSKSAVEVLDGLLGKMRGGLEIVQSVWKSLPVDSGVAAKPFADRWAEILASGIVPEPATDDLTLVPTPNLAVGLASTKSSDFDLVVMPDPTLHDGRFANIGWLQELPKPLTQLTWDNAFHMSRGTAKRFGVGQVVKTAVGTPYYGNWDVVRVSANGTTVEGPVYVHDGMADDTVVVHMGFGRKRAGQIGNVGDEIHQGGGFDAMPLRTTSAPVIVSGGTLEKTGRNYKLANTQFHNLLDVTEIDSKRDIIRETTLEEYKKDPHVLHEPTTPVQERKGEKHESPSIFKQPPGYNGPDNYQWAMTIDLNLCSGCGACVAACQAENNIPTVGKEQTLRHRMLHWIRVDRYYRAYSGKSFESDDPVITFQPVNCMHCEMAPCEPVCPVAATTHSHEGLNQMVYNRCVGTRYCSNNCPYKVRRFNYLHYTKKTEDVPVLKLLQNPDVTVRGRGVMEKCTYCVHRINNARIKAKKGDRKIKDGEVQTACQQACPSRAIVFGDKNDPNNAVSKSRASNRQYVLLEAVNTLPRTTYLGKVRNPNPELEA